ncbi:MAG: hypothetical protein KAR20_17295 [Candidatus Heimdallarchaeota archaeon]|nr:hypothetical protein [Candidatus Heimdallarchaeota archaeon]
MAIVTTIIILSAQLLICDGQAELTDEFRAFFRLTGAGYENGGESISRVDRRLCEGTGQVFEVNEKQRT